MSPWRSLLLDFAAIAVFAAIGRSSHAEGLSFAGVLITAGPFLAGCLVGTLIVHLLRLAFWPSGIAVWLSTVAVGMILRVLTGPGTQLSFIIVATISLGVLLLGWRGVVVLLRRRQAPTASQPVDPSTGSGQAELRGG